MKKPYFRFHPDNWINNSKLQSVSLSARGLFAELMCFGMSEKGQGYCPDMKNLEDEAAFFGVEKEEYYGSRRELIDVGLLRRDRNGRLYSPQIRSQYERTVSSRANGCKGGSPDLGGKNSPKEQGTVSKSRLTQMPFSQSRLTQNAPKGKNEGDRSLIQLEAKEITGKKLPTSNASNGASYLPLAYDSVSSNSKKEDKERNVVVNNNTKKEKKKEEIDPLKVEFEAFWKSYPNKQGKLRAEDYYREWRKTKSAEELSSSLAAYVLAKRKARNDTFSNGSTFLNPRPRGDSANISDFFQSSFFCGKCLCRNLDNGLCSVTMERVRADAVACERYERDTNG